MILEFDIGNTRSKWRLLKEGSVMDCGSFAGRDIQAFSQLPLFSDKPARVRVASVAEDGFQEEFSAWCRSSYGCAAEFAKTTAHCAGVTNSYVEPERMGVDRWLAMLAGYNQAKDACCIIDCGSAITVDVVDCAGCHQGGFIVPGLKMQADVLLRNTGRVRFEDTSQDEPNTALGKNTLDAVQHGIVSMVLAWLEAEVKRYSKVFLSGGDAEFLLKGLPEANVSVQTDIVMQGLKFALP